ncbi:unnamed protein product [Parnassius apollo]|uniref:(apollo) hypothetical protein n=1 Tax=Parnassius apollo TaxID=110799 RepID=A0A8S3XGC8_PARAO|nr:unnamed protein product [Parnassius apollo]
MSRKGSQRGRGNSQRGRGPSQRNRGVSQRGLSVSRRHHLPDRSSSAPSTSHGTSRYRTRDRVSRNDQLPDLSGNPPPSVRAQSEAAQRNRDPSRRRLWKSIPFDQKEHNFPPREQQTIRTPLEYIEDYFHDAFYEKAAYCTNNYYLRQTGRVLHTNPIEMKKFIGVHFIMGCITYPRLHMYWRQEMRLTLVADIIPRDRLKLLRTNFHVVEEDIAPVVANAWRLYKIHCQAAHVHRGQVFDLLQFELQVADGLTNTPDRPRPEKDPVENMEGLEAQDPENSTQISLPRDTDRLMYL